MINRSILSSHIKTILLVKIFKINLKNEAIFNIPMLLFASLSANLIWLTKQVKAKYQAYSLFCTVQNDSISANNKKIKNNFGHCFSSTFKARKINVFCRVGCSTGNWKAPIKQQPYLGKKFRTFSSILKV